MSTAIPSLTEPLAPLERAERIEALDVVRGFALIGILLMNIEFFNRATNDIGSGLQPGLTGANYWFSWFVQYFVVGKFWTIFSLLFGMGFAVMLMRAEAAQRSFLVPYLRRIAALALFGVLHYILFWPGDILFSYAVGAIALLTVLYGKPKYILLAIAAFGVAGAAGNWEWPFVIASCLAFFGMCAWYLRAPERVTVLGRSVPVFRLITRFLMAGSALALLVGLVAPELPRQGRIAMIIVGAAILILSTLMARFHHPESARPWRMGVGLYVLSAGLMVAFSAAHYYYPDPNDALVANMAAPGKADVASTKPKTDLEQALERKKKRAERRAEHKAEIEAEVRVLTRGTFAQAVEMRARDFVKRAPDQIGFATMIVTMFLLGTWFVRSGIMTNTGEHLPLFRKLALIALPFGLGLGLLGALIATADTPGVNNGFDLAFGLLMLGNLPACLGYMSLVVLMLNSGTALAQFCARVLAPFGRMALTNYLTHSVVFTTIFYGYGLGYFGIERVWQFACVVAMVALQIPLSYWWLARFRYGPMEWLWRAITYWQIPAMRLVPEAAGQPQIRSLSP